MIVLVVGALVEIYSFVILARLLLSWVPLRPGTPVYRLYGILYSVTEPYLRIFRRFIPYVHLGNTTLDLSPVVGLVVLFIVQQLVFFL